MRWCYRSLVGLVAVGLAGACADEDEDPPKLGILEECIRDDDCESGLVCTTAFHRCTHSCTTDADCEAGRCATNADGTRFCLYECGQAPTRPEGWVCVDGVLMHCDSNPCAPDQVCVANAGCLLPEGASCTDDWDCVSDYCSPTRLTCNVEAGGPCNHANCDDCRTIAGLQGWTFCSRRCEGMVDCGDSGTCLGTVRTYYDDGFPEGYEYWCVPLCFDECPECEWTAATDSQPPYMWCPALVSFTCDPAAQPSMLDGVAQGLCETL